MELTKRTLRIRKIKTGLEMTGLFLVLILTAASVAWAIPLDFNVIGGEWGRVDGTYILRVKNVTPEGTAEVSYHNPGIIHVSESRISTRNGRIQLFVKLNDKGYPGSAYTLYYYPEQDVLAGFYYQALEKQAYEVVFVRK